MTSTHSRSSGTPVPGSPFRGGPGNHLGSDLRKPVWEQAGTSRNHRRNPNPRNRGGNRLRGSRDGHARLQAWFACMCVLKVGQIIRRYYPFGNPRRYWALGSLDTEWTRNP